VSPTYVRRRSHRVEATTWCRSGGFRRCHRTRSAVRSSSSGTSVHRRRRPRASRPNRRNTAATRTVRHGTYPQSVIRCRRFSNRLGRSSTYAEATRATSRDPVGACNSAWVRAATTRRTRARNDTRSYAPRKHRAARPARGQGPRHQLRSATILGAGSRPCLRGEHVQTCAICGDLDGT
jgi:hypothetical protein